MTTADGRPARGAGWADVVAPGVVAFVAMAAIGQALALLVWSVAETGASLGAFARIGWMYFGAFHHVAIQADVADLDVAGAGPGSTSLSVGVALMAFTAVAGLLLFRAGRRLADRVGGRPAARVLLGAAVAPSYALPAFVTALLVEARTPFRFGASATGQLHVALSAWQAFAFPLAIAAAAGAAGGLRSALDDRGDVARLRWVAAAAAGGWRMLVAGSALSLAGLFVAGVLQPEEPVALLTPTTARYFELVFDRPAEGLVLLGHHLAVAPNEAMWTLVPSMGGCDGVRGSAGVNFLCYTRFPTSVETGPQTLDGERVVVPAGEATFGGAPLGYLSFLLVPAAATVLGGRRAALLVGGTRRERMVAGAAAGAVFALLVGLAALLSTATIGYGAAFGQGGSAGWIVVGPNAVTGTLLALPWGLAGGAVGAATAGRRVSSTTPSSTRARSPR